jgi:hypothetical protein
MQTFGENVGVFGLYELSDDGTILYSRPRGQLGLDQPTPEFVGQDFFHDIVGCENKDDLRRHFRQFIVGGRPVDAFLFDCLFEREIVRTKIFMTRAFETDDEHANGIVIMDIRQAGQ